MSDDALRRYLAQRVAMGEGRVWLGGRMEEGQERQATHGGLDPAARESSAPPAPSRISSAQSAPSHPAKWTQDAPPIPGAGITVPSPPEADLFKRDPLAKASLDDIAALVVGCTICALHRGRTHAVPGEGPHDARLMVVGEGPGQNEDETGRPFVGRAGKLLDDVLAAIECPRSTVFIANIVKCRPPKNRKPAPDETAACIPYLYRQIAVIRPKVLLALGATAAEVLLGVRQSLGSLRNKVHVFRGIPLVVTYHPAALLRNPNWKRPTWDDVRIARQLLDQ